jgi:AcrR family transcriptional regulator
VATFYNCNAQRLERRDCLVHADCRIPALAAGRCSTLPRLPSRLVARHVAHIRAGDSHVSLFGRASVDSSNWHLEVASVARRSVASDGPHPDRLLLGSDSSLTGHSTGHVCAEIPAAHEYTLAACVIFPGVRRADDLAGHSFSVARAAAGLKEEGVGVEQTKKKVPLSLDDAHPRGEPASGAPKNERSSEVVSAAYSLIAEKGFEGLRTREVADKVGINSATLHYYFPTKEALIQGVVEHLMQELRTSRAKPKDPLLALDRLSAEFADIRLRLKEVPDQLAVLTELAVRAWRDPAIARMLQYLDDGWRGHLTSILEAGIAEGVFASIWTLQPLQMP